MTRPTVTGIVLAGGRGSRFGGPKLDAKIGGESLLVLATRAVAEVADEVLIAGPLLPDVTGVDGVAIRLVTDAAPFEGPLVAVAGSLRQSGGALAIVVGGDMPRLVSAVLRAMLERLASDATVDAVTLEAPALESGEPARIATLPLALRVTPAVEVAAEAIRAGDRSLVRLLGRLRATAIPSIDWQALDPNAVTLVDIDRPADLDRIARELR